MVNRSCLCCSFRRTDENLFRGLPAKKPTTRNTSLFGDEGKKDNPLFGGGNKNSLFSDNDDDLDFGGYQPSLGTGGGKAKPTARGANPEDTWKSSNKKTDILTDLFGNTTSQPTTKPDDDLFSTAPAAKPTTSRKANLPWENHDNSSNLFGGDKMLPRRPRADNSTIPHNKPTVRAIDSFNDDDLEEVIL